MKNLIFTLYFDIDEKDLDKEDFEKNLFTKKQLSKYQSHLILNKISYSKKFNSDFICFTEEEDLKNFSQRFDFDTPKYVIINFYKLHLLDKLSDEYDNIVYLDHDVHIKKFVNIFNSLDFTKLNVWQENVKDQLIEYINFYKDRQLFSRSYLNKCLTSYCTSFTFDWPVSYNKINTGVIASNKKAIKDLNIDKNLSFLLAHKKEIEYNNNIPESIRGKFKLNNEAFLANIIQKEKVEVENLEEQWHHILTYNNNLEDYHNTDSILYHFINKEFSWIWSLDSKDQ